MKSFGENVISYYKSITRPENIPGDVEVLFPFDSDEVISLTESFYGKYFDDRNKRTFLIGINPGRFGGGSTGIPFTDPKVLEEELKIPNSLDKRHELSSRFIYRMINDLGGPEKFYESFYFTSVCPLGFVRNGKNLNYYDDKQLEEGLEEYMAEEMRKQIAFGANEVAFSLGMGKNIKFLNSFNKRHQLFSEIRPLPHPRWVMQYRLKRLEEFIAQYAEALSTFI
ncbi:MAG: DUF4918 family protein [Cyclobacteriaceae bacterium]